MPYGKTLNFAFYLEVEGRLNVYPSERGVLFLQYSLTSPGGRLTMILAVQSSNDYGNRNSFYQHVKISNRVNKDLI